MTTFDTLRLDTLVTSPTNPRKNFNEGRLQELADSIAASGVHQPILVRPLPGSRLQETFAIHGENGLKPRPTHEIVAGERRYRASQLAKVDTIPAMIRELTDDQVLEIQIVENIQRDSLTELETAEGYKTLMEHNNLTAEQVGQKVSKSRSSVYGSLKLLDLHPFAKQALRDERINASTALLIARIPDIALQSKATLYASPDNEGEAPSIRVFQSWLRDNVMLDLSKATFPIESISLTAAGSCKTCKTRTGHDPDLFADVKSDMCTHPPCYHLKAESHKQALARMTAAKAPIPNRNVDEQQGLGLVSTLAQDARAEQSKMNAADRVKTDIEAIKGGMAKKVAGITRIAIFDVCSDYIKRRPDGATHLLIGVELLRAWLSAFINWQDEDTIDQVLGMSTNKDIVGLTALQDAATLRVQAAGEADIFRWTALAMLSEDRNVHSYHLLDATHLFDGFTADHGIDTKELREVVAEDVEAEAKTQIAALNKQIKAEKTTSTPPPAGAAIDTGEADAKKPKPAGASRKAKTTEQEAISGIAAAMQGLGSEPLDAALGGSEMAAITESNGVKVGQTVEVQFGRHFGKTGTVTDIVCDNMFDVRITNGFKVRLCGQQFEKVDA